MKSKILLLLFLGILTSQAQAVKKSIAPKKTTTAVKAKVLTPTLAEGIFATIATNKGWTVTF